MISLLSTPRRSSLSLQLLRHFSIRVSPLKKQSLVAQLLRGNGSPKLTKFTQKGGLFLDPRSNGAKATQHGDGEASLRSVYQHSPLCVSVQPPVLENGRQQEQRLVENDACIAKLSVRSKKESKNIIHRDDATKLSTRSLREGSKAHHSHGDTQLPMLPDPTKVSVQSQIAGEGGHRSCGPVEFKPGGREGKRLALQTRWVSREPCLPVSKLGISPLRTGSSKEISSLASQIGDEAGKCITGNVSTTERGEEQDEQNATKDTLSLKNSVPSVGSKQLKVKIAHPVIRKQTISDKLLHDLYRKIELVIVESAPLTHVKTMLTKRDFLSASPEKLAEVLTVLKLFFESGDKACQILTGNTRIIAQPLEQLQQRLQVLVEFEVDKATCYRLGTRSYMMSLKVENYRSVLSFLKELGLSAESRNRMICRYPVIMRSSLESRMQRNVNFLESIKTPRPTVLKLLESCPRTLCLVIDKNLMVMHKVYQHVGLSAKEFVKALITMSQYSTVDYFFVIQLLQRTRIF